MDAQVWIAYTTTVLVLMSTPGPSHLLMLSNSMSQGFPRSLATAAGDLIANLLQMLAAGLGLATLILASDRAFTAIKWLGVAYLLWLGLKMIVRPGQAAQDDSAGQTSTRQLWLQGFVTSAANPKAVIFFAALFPQFLDPARSLWPQWLALTATYLLIDALFLAAYGAGADWLSGKLQGRSRLWLERLGGAFMIGAAVLLGMRTLRRV